MKTTKELLLHHLDHTFEKEAYFYTSLTLAVRGLTSAQAAWKPSPGRHSIWQIVRHVAHWKKAAISALDGNPLDYDERNRADWQEVMGDQRDWEVDLGRLGAISQEIRARVEARAGNRKVPAAVWSRPHGQRRRRQHVS